MPHGGAGEFGGWSAADAWASAAEGMLAKRPAGVDVMSGGRLSSRPWQWLDKAQSLAYGYRLPSARERVDAFAETLEAVTRLWISTESTSNPRRELQPATTRSSTALDRDRGPRGFRVAARSDSTNSAGQPRGPFRRKYDFSFQRPRPTVSTSPPSYGGPIKNVLTSW